MGVGNCSRYNYKLHALDLATGRDALTPTIISASVTGTVPATTFFVRFRERCRPGLLLLNGTLYLGFGAFCEAQGHNSGCLLSYRESDLSQVAVLTIIRTAQNQVAVFGNRGLGPEATQPTVKVHWLTTQQATITSLWVIKPASI